ncbi:MAG: hypothetical protein KAR19_03710 [Bacteroidales bacterium]|nr:hypothetical protein [Bacteroidales bacterium]
MSSDESILEVVFRYAKMKYTPEKICVLLGLTKKQTTELLIRFEDPDDPIRIKYEQGKAISDYRMDKALEKAGARGNPLAISELSTRQYHRMIDELKKELFNI